MSLFNKYRPIGYKLKEPERITPSEARERRLAALLEREQRFETVPNFNAVRQKLQVERSRVITKNILNDDNKYRQKAASIAAALATFTERDFSDPQKRADYRDLRNAQLAHENAKLSGGGRRKVNPTGVDQRSFNPSGPHPSTVTGTAARFATRLYSGFAPGFHMATHVVPCIQRHAQREVMFAKGYAGRGYHTRKRRTYSSGVPC